MSAGTPARTKREQDAQRQAYLNTLKMDVSNIQKNYNANEIYKATGTAAIPKSTETTTEKGATLQGRKQMIKDALVSAGIMNSFVAENFIDALGEPNIEFFLQHSQPIIEGFKPKNVPAKVFLAYFKKYERKFTESEGLDMGIPMISGADFALDTKSMEAALAGNRQALEDFKEQIRQTFRPDEARRLVGRIDVILESIPSPEELEELQRLEVEQRETIEEAIRQQVLRAPNFQQLLLAAEQAGMRDDPAIVNMGQELREGEEAVRLVRQQEQDDKVREAARQIEEEAARQAMEKARKDDIRSRMRAALLHAKEEGRLEPTIDVGQAEARRELVELTDAQLDAKTVQELKKIARDYGVAESISKGADRKKLLLAIKTQQKKYGGRENAAPSVEELSTLNEKELRTIANNLGVDTNIIAKGDTYSLVNGILAQVKIGEAAAAEAADEGSESDEDLLPAEIDSEDEGADDADDDAKDRFVAELVADPDFPTADDILRTNPADWPPFIRNVERNLLQRARREGLRITHSLPYQGRWYTADILLNTIEADENKMAEFVDGLRQRRRVFAFGLRGAGLSRSKQKTPVEKSEGYKKPVQYVQFGRYMIHHPKLKDGILQLRTPKGGAIKALPTEYLSPRVKDMMITMVGNGSPSLEDFHRLSADEKEKLHHITRHSQYEKISIPKGNMDKEEQELHRFTILKGEIMAGNNNRQLLKEFKTMLMKFVGEGKVPRRQANEILSELAKEGL